MQGPIIKSTITDEEANVTYHVRAYRPLARDEMIATIRYYHSQASLRRRKTPLHNKVIAIITTLGATGGL